MALGTFGIVRVQTPDMSKPFVAFKRFPKIMILLVHFKVCISLFAFFGELLVVPRVSFANLLFGEAHSGNIWVVCDLDRDCVSRLRAYEADFHVHGDRVGGCHVIIFRGDIL